MKSGAKEAGFWEIFKLHGPVPPCQTPYTDESSSGFIAPKAALIECVALRLDLTPLIPPHLYPFRLSCRFKLSLLWKSAI